MTVAVRCIEHSRQPAGAGGCPALYQVDALPDRDDPVYRAMAGGDVHRAIAECHEHLLRALVTYPAGSAALTLRFAFAPASEPSQRQSRLAVTISARARGQQVAGALRVLIECSDIGAYYGLREVPGGDLPTRRGRASCHVTRIEQAIRPLHAPQDNPAIPPAYYVCLPFQPRTGNDYLALDRILDRVAEPVVVEMVFEPADVTEEQFMHTRYLARLQSVNRVRDYDDEEGGAQADPFEPDTYSRSGGHLVVKPLRRRDPLADDVSYGQRRFHETLTKPQLTFCLRVTAETVAVAQLVASVVAESAFKDGSYHLWAFDTESAPDEVPRGPVLCADTGCPPTLELTLGDHASTYRQFRRLAHVATVDELLGAFTLPVASRNPLRCIRGNTEPPLVPREQLLVFGHDE